MVSVSEVGEEGLQESQGRDDAAQTAFARREGGGTPQPRLGRMGKVLQVRVSVAAVRESERLRAVSSVQVPQQEEPAAISAGIRRDLLRRTTGTRAYGPHQKEVLPMTPVSHGKPCAGNPHARFEEGASAPESPRRNALLHSEPKCPKCGSNEHVHLVSTCTKAGTVLGASAGVAGSLGGAPTGAMAGAALCSFLPGIGTVLGALGGGIVGALFGASAGGTAGYGVGKMMDKVFAKYKCEKCDFEFESESSN